jgi:hypothetical protein
MAVPPRPPGVTAARRHGRRGTCQRAARGWSRVPSASTTSMVPTPASRATGGAHPWTTAGELRAAHSGRPRVVVPV